jgi:hypothetical protein
MSPVIKRVLMADVVAVPGIPGGAPAQTMHDASTSASVVQWHHRPSASHPSITFTNPLGRSRGPGAGAGLL